MLGTIPAQLEEENKTYRQQRQRFPLRSPQPQSGILPTADRLFNQLCLSTTKLPPRERFHNAWISDMTWTLVDQIGPLQGSPEYSQAWHRQLSCALRPSLLEDHRICAQRISMDIKLAITSFKSKEAWALIRGWYQQATNHLPHPS